MSNTLRGIRRVATTAGTIALAAAALLGTAHAASASTAGQHGIQLPGNPSRSMKPGTALLSSCTAGDDTSTCNQLALTAISQARRSLEKMSGMTLSLAAYDRLTPAQQLFVVVNLERTERGLAPAAVLSRSLSRIAQAGAQAGRDPALGSIPRTMPGGGRTATAGSVWSGGWINPLGADYAWMYDDGPGGANLDCTTSHHAGCWGHRDVILTRTTCPLAIGTGHATAAAGYRESDTVLITSTCGHTPTDATFTWTKAKHLLGIR